MEYCTKCGRQLEPDAMFCANCGEKRTAVVYVPEQRKTVYDGEIHKCPNCGEILNSFVLNCTACGYELRGVKSSNAVSELSINLQRIESLRNERNSTAIRRGFFAKGSDDIDEQKINLIRNFTIPNTKEDILEFAVLAAANIDKTSYDDSYGYLSHKINTRRRDLSNAWMSKLEQAYQKAKIILAGDPRLYEIQAIYNSTHKSVKKEKSKIWKIISLYYSIPIALLGIIFIIVFGSLSNAEKKEIERLESIVAEINFSLETGDYKYALMNADNLRCREGGTAEREEWEIKREYYIEIIIEKAAENGIILEHPDAKKEKEETTTTEQYEDVTEVQEEDFESFDLWQSVQEDIQSVVNDVSSIFDISTIY